MSFKFKYLREILQLNIEREFHTKNITLTTKLKYNS